MSLMMVKCMVHNVHNDLDCAVNFAKRLLILSEEQQVLKFEG